MLIQRVVYLERRVESLSVCMPHWASGEIQNRQLALICRKKVAEPSVRRLLDCYAKQFFHQKWRTCQLDVFAFVILKEGRAHLRSPRLLCVRSLGSPWYDYVYFNSASSGIQWVVSLLQWLTKLSVLNVPHYATMNNKTSVKHNWRCFKSWSAIGP